MDDPLHDIKCIKFETKKKQMKELLRESNSPDVEQKISEYGDGIKMAAPMLRCKH